MKCYHSGPEWTWERGQKRILLIRQGSRITGATPSDCFVSYQGLSLRGSLPLGRVVVGVFYNSSRLGHMHGIPRNGLNTALHRDSKQILNEQFGHSVIKHLEIMFSEDKEFAHGPEGLGSIPGQVIPKTQKMELGVALLNTQHYKVRIKGKVEQSRERSSALSYTLVL